MLQKPIFVVKKESSVPGWAWAGAAALLVVCLAIAAMLGLALFRTGRQNAALVNRPVTKPAVDNPSGDDLLPVGQDQAAADDNNASVPAGDDSLSQHNDSTTTNDNSSAPGNDAPHQHLRLPQIHHHLLPMVIRRPHQMAIDYRLWVGLTRSRSNKCCNRPI